MATDLLERSAVELRGLVLAKEVSPVELLDRTLERLEHVEPRLNSFVTVTEETARVAARAAERAVLDGDAPGLLHGLPVSVKDLIAMDGVRCTFGSKSAANNVATLDAPAVERVREAGAVIVGKTTTSEFGCKAVGDSPLTGITRNPWNLAKTPGGSSAGAAASVAAGVTPFALGTDGGGSVRIPGSLTGLFAIKPQFARVPVFPESAAPTLAHVGPMARTVRDAALLLTAIAGFDRHDPFSVAEPVPDYLSACDQSVRGMRIAWSPTMGYADPVREVVGICEQAVGTLEDLGCEVELVDEVMERDPIDMWMVRVLRVDWHEAEHGPDRPARNPGPRRGRRSGRCARPDGRRVLDTGIQPLSISRGDARIHGGLRSAGFSGAARAGLRCRTQRSPSNVAVQHRFLGSIYVPVQPDRAAQRVGAGRCDR